MTRAWLLVILLVVGVSWCGPRARGAEATFPDGVQWNPTPHHGERRATEITAIIYHYTAGGSLEGTLKWFQNPQSRVSSHYVVGKDGTVVQMVALERAAWHAGRSVLGGVDGVNDLSIGFEIVNWGKLSQRDGKFYTYTGRPYEGAAPVEADGAYWEPYTDQQYEAVARVTAELIAKYPIQYITGHSDIATPKGRKIDPGGAFDWARVRAKLPASYRGHAGPLPSEGGRRFSSG